MFGRVRVKYIDSVPTLPVKSQIVFMSADGNASHHWRILRSSDEIFFVKNFYLYFYEFVGKAL